MKRTPGTPTHLLSNDDSKLLINDDSKLLITPSNATNSATRSLATISVTQTEAGQGELNNAASWDDFPNGRFGDYKSPAFGDQDLRGGSHISVWQI